MSQSYVEVVGRKEKGQGPSTYFTISHHCRWLFLLLVRSKCLLKELIFGGARKSSNRMPNLPTTWFIFWSEVSWVIAGDVDWRGRVIMMRILVPADVSKLITAYWQRRELAICTWIRPERMTNYYGTGGLSLAADEIRELDETRIVEHRYRLYTNCIVVSDWLQPQIV